MRERRREGERERKREGGEERERERETENILKETKWKGSFITTEKK